MLYPFYVPAVARVDECTSLSKTRAWSVFPSLLPVDRSLAWKAAACSDSLFLSFSISAKDSRVVRANCNAILSWWPGGVSCTLTLYINCHCTKYTLRRSWSRRMNWGNLWIGFTINPKKLSLSAAVICFTCKKSAKADFRFDSDLANSIAWLKLLMKSE